MGCDCGCGGTPGCCGSLGPLRFLPTKDNDTTNKPSEKIPAEQTQKEE
jgi:hypothetical protein